MEQSTGQQVPRGFRAWRVKPPSPVFARPLRADETDAASATKREGANDGDYLLQYPDGAESVTDGSTFLAHYEPVDANDGWQPEPAPAPSAQPAGEPSPTPPAPAPIAGEGSTAGPLRQYRPRSIEVGARPISLEETNAASPNFRAGAQLGDFLVRYPDGSEDVVPAAIFAQEYEQIV
jgi:hypothetical protein